MPEILHLNLHREFFDAIARKQKRIEYRKAVTLLRKRLENRKYDPAMAMRKDAQEMLVEFCLPARPERNKRLSSHLFYLCTFARPVRQSDYPPRASEWCARCGMPKLTDGTGALRNPTEVTP